MPRRPDPPAPGDDQALPSQTAVRMVAAARRILDRDGFEGLSFDALAEEAGVYRDSIRYHFGSKAGLIAAVVDDSTREASIEIYAKALGADGLEDRLRTVIAASRELPGTEAYQSIWELLPHVIRNHELRERVAVLYEEFRGHYEEVLYGPDLLGEKSVVRRYASLMLAMIDGLAIQKALDPANVDLDDLFELWADIAARSVGGVSSASSRPGD